MEKVSIIGLDLAKPSFQAHGALADGGVGFRKKLSREKVLAFFAEQPRCLVAMEACGSAHPWGRAIGDLGHEVRLIPLAYVKPFVKRQKNEATDAEAMPEGLYCLPSLILSWFSASLAPSLMVPGIGRCRKPRSRSTSFV